MILTHFAEHYHNSCPDSSVLSVVFSIFHFLFSSFCQVFVTHGGNNGQYEAVYHGVPMVGLHVGGDQQHNCFRMVGGVFLQRMIVP